MPEALAVYACSICQEQYPTEQEAQTCEDRGLVGDIKGIGVGDFVLCSAGFGWADGDTQWIENIGKLPKPKKNPKHGNCFDSCCTWQFWYVVTHIGRKPWDKHLVAYHVATLAMTDGSGYGGGWTSADHCCPRKTKRTPPAAVVESAKKLIGRQFEHLL